MQHQHVDRTIVNAVRLSVSIVNAVRLGRILGYFVGTGILELFALRTFNSCECTVPGSINSSLPPFLSEAPYLRRERSG